jgi:TRAP-type C4-dicarboxylate transport system substrate-binding protein
MRDFSAAAVVTTYLRVLVRLRRSSQFHAIYAIAIKMGNSMFKALALGALLSFALLPSLATAEPVELKFSFFTSDRSNIYQTTIKPFVEAVNNEGKGLIEIKVYFSGAISPLLTQQPQLVADGTADMAIIVPPLSPDRFGDSSVMELPGIYRDPREASLVFIRLIEAGALKGYGDFFVIDAFVSGPENVHSRKPISAIEDLKGLTIRTNNQTQAAVLQKLGAIPVLLPINQATDAISRGKIDAAAFPPSLLFDFGIGRVTNYHFMIELGSVPIAVVMNRSKFESLPPPAQAIIRKNSGQGLTERSALGLQTLDIQVLEQLKSDPRRKVTDLSPTDLESTRRTFASVVADWAAMSPHNRELLTLVQSEIKKLRSSN